jgi:hypothetical protein
VGGARAQRLDRGLDDMRRGREVRFADFQVDDLGAGVLEGPGASEHLERPLGAEFGHPVGELESGHGLDHKGELATDDLLVLDAPHKSAPLGTGELKRRP